jgi:hypothetical protein
MEALVAASLSFWTKDLVPGGNILVLLMLFLGCGVLWCLYGFEWYARVNCPRVLVNILHCMLSCTCYKIGA